MSGSGVENHGQGTVNAYTPLAREQVRAARLTTARQARDANDLAMLLEMLGLDENVRVLEET